MLLSIVINGSIPIWNGIFLCRDLRDKESGVEDSGVEWSGVYHDENMHSMHSMKPE